MGSAVENPSKYLGNELEYLQKVLEGESWSATGGSWHFQNELEQSMGLHLTRALPHCTQHWKR